MNENKEKLDLLSKKFKVIGKLTLASIALAIVFHFFVGEFMHWKTYDFMMKFVGGKESKPHKDVVLLLIDENSMRYGQALGLGRWPWKRNIYPEILQYINATNPPKGVFFDILFSESGVSSQNDSAFSQAIAASGNIFHNILLVFLNLNS